MKFKAIVCMLYLKCSLECVFGDIYHSRPKNKKLPQPRLAATSLQDAAFWIKVAEKELEKSLETYKNLNTNKAKNIILFIGDGMSIPTLTASRIYKAQHKARMSRKVASGEESLLSFEMFPHVGLSKTYCVDYQTVDSAASASAIFSGIKTNYFTLGFDSSIKAFDIQSEKEAKKVKTIMTWAQDANKDTGFITTTRVSHATPAALYAHSADRDWECNKKNVVDGTLDSKDITWQLVNTDPGRKAKVVFGGGRSSFLPAEPPDSRWNYSTINWNCTRQDNLNLIDEFFMKDPKVVGFEGKKGKLVENRGQLKNISVNEVDYLLGLFNWNVMKFEHQREKGADKPEEEPSLTEMTEVAIKMLQKNPNGFFLMVEGGLIDYAHHAGKANVALHETIAFDAAIEKALSMVNLNETLIIVTADHGHTMSHSGYKQRGGDIRGIIEDTPAEDDKSYSILSYANGPGFFSNLKVQNGIVSRVNLASIANFTEFEFLQPSSAPTKMETHSGTDVGIFAIGPYAHLFHSVHEQNYIGYVMAYSACIGPYKRRCHTKNKDIS